VTFEEVHPDRDPQPKKPPRQRINVRRPPLRIDDVTQIGERFWFNLSTAASYLHTSQAATKRLAGPLHAERHRSSQYLFDKDRLDAYLAGESPR
jgi:hypothetical protein